MWPVKLYKCFWLINIQRLLKNVCLAKLSVHYRSLTENHRHCFTLLQDKFTVCLHSSCLPHFYCSFETLPKETCSCWTWITLKKSTLVSYSILRNYTSGLACDFPGNIYSSCFGYQEHFSSAACISSWAQLVITTSVDNWRVLLSSAPEWNQKILISWQGDNGIPNFLTRIRGQ